MKIIDLNGNERDCLKAYPDPDFPGYMRIEYKNEVRSYHEWYPVKEFKDNNPNLSSLTKGVKVEAEEVVGTVSSATGNTLTDKDQSWATDAYKDFPVWISRGTGEGQTRTITSNSKNMVTVDKPWDIKPDKRSQYVISKNIHDPQVMGNTLPG